MQQAVVCHRCGKVVVLLIGDDSAPPPPQIVVVVAAVGGGVVDGGVVDQAVAKLPCRRCRACYRCCATSVAACPTAQDTRVQPKSEGVQPGSAIANEGKARCTAYGTAAATCMKVKHESTRMSLLCNSYY